MLKPMLLMMAAIALLAVGAVAARGCAGLASGPGGLQHSVRLLGYEVTLGARVARLQRPEVAVGPDVPACGAALRDTVFVLVLPVTQRGGDR